MTEFDADWSIDEDADEWANTIDGVDPNSTYSRYPSVRDPTEDQAKSPFKATAQEDMFPPDAPPDRRIVALVIENQDREFVKAYVNEKGVEPDQAYTNALERMCEMLFNYHAMMRFELTGGF